MGQELFVISSKKSSIFQQQIILILNFKKINKILFKQFNSDGYHVSPTHQRTPLVPRDLGEDFSLDLDGDDGGGAGCSNSRPLDPRKPKNAK